MAYAVTLLKKTTKTSVGEHGQYTYVELTVDYQGQESTKRILPGTMKKFPNLTEELKNAKEGTVIKLTTVPNGDFVEISKIESLPSSDYKPYSKQQQSTSNDTNVGAQVGNALTNACRSLGREKKVTMSEIEIRAWELILLGERLKTRLTKGEHLKDLVEPDFDPHFDHQSSDLDNDVPF